MPEFMFGQLSPGELSNPHKHLEGLGNCTQCHTLGEKLSNQKCLDCHKELDARVKAGKGFHSSKEVKNKNCASCHNDHHGRDFQLVRLDKNSFDHDLTGYKLTGKHKGIDCRECHKPDYVSKIELKKNKNTYLGVATDCKSCHKDSHQGTLGTACASCHNTTAFAPADGFNHSKTDFALFGAHTEVKCLECHPKEVKNGENFQRFKDIKHSNCTDCHKDPHEKKLGMDCKVCHTEQGWAKFVGKGRFDHNKRTEFDLVFKHQNLDCKVCHDLKLSPSALFQDKKSVQQKDCAACHKDVHDNKFGISCAECHTEQGFKLTKLDGFNHERTNFALFGKHKEVDCKKCHTSGSMTDNIPFANCTDCHKDAHNGAFLKEGKSPDCVQCHDVFGFSPSIFGIEDHAKTRFPLDGAHEATSCLDCHTPDNPEGEWEFRAISTDCFSCHGDAHAGSISESFYSKTNCNTCHVTENWQKVNFDHTKTAFVLEGKHRDVACRACHKPTTEHPKGKFIGLNQECAQCHKSPHGTQFEDAQGQTNCARCHGAMDWTAPKFDHSQTLFPLSGKHANVECKACHKPEMTETGPIVVYKVKNFECIDCHQ